MADVQAATPPQPEPPRARKAREGTVGWIIAAVAGVLVLLIMVFACGTCFVVTTIFRGSGYGGSGVGLIEVNGVIASGGTGAGLFEGICSSDEVVEQLHRARKERRVKAVLLRVNSPGGTPAAAEEVFEEIRRTSRKKPVVVSIGDIGASGAYLLSSAADYIYASPDSDVGSIGVITQIPNIQELNKKIGVSYTVLTQGEYKDIGSPLRPVTPEEQAILSQQARIAYDHFIRDVAEGRGLEFEKVAEMANGLTWPGTVAREKGLIDEVGNYWDAAEKAARMGGIKGEVHLIKLEEDSGWSLLRMLVDGVRDVADTARYLRGESDTTNNQPVKR